MDGVLDLDAFLLEQVGHLAQRVLGLGHRHAVAGHDDHRLGVLHDVGRVLRRAGLDRAALAAARRRRRRPAVAAEAAEDDVEDRAVHALAHDVGQDRARGADQRAGDDQQVVLQREADARRRPAGVAVQHRDDHRHVRPADRQDQQEAQRQRDQNDDPQRHAGVRLHQPDDQQHREDAQRGVEMVLVGEDQRLAGDQPLELGEGDDGAGEGDRADGRAERHLDQRALGDGPGDADAVGLGRVEGRERDEHRGQTDQRVEGGDELRQGGHLDLAGDDVADAAADRDAEHDHPVGLDDGQGQRGQHGDGHAGHAEDVALAGGLGAGQAAQGHDEAHRGGQIEKGSQAFHLTYPSS